jgi:hypothetical protein
MPVECAGYEIQAAFQICEAQAKKSAKLGQRNPLNREVKILSLQSFSDLHLCTFIKI